MKYWIPVILEQAFICRDCGEVIGRGNRVYLKVDIDDKMSPFVSCSKCFGNRFPPVLTFDEEP